MSPSRQDVHLQAKGGSEEPLMAQVPFMGQLQSCTLDDLLQQMDGIYPGCVPNEGRWLPHWPYLLGVTSASLPDIQVHGPHYIGLYQHLWDQTHMRFCHLGCLNLCILHEVRSPNSIQPCLRNRAIFISHLGAQPFRLLLLQECLFICSSPPCENHCWRKETQNSGWKPGKCSFSFFCCWEHSSRKA